MSDKKCGKSLLDGMCIKETSNTGVLTEKDYIAFKEPVFSTREFLIGEAKRLRSEADRLDRLSSECDKLSSESAEAILNIYFRSMR